MYTRFRATHNDTVLIMSVEQKAIFTKHIALIARRYTIAVIEHDLAKYLWSPAPISTPSKAHINPDNGKKIPRIVIPIETKSCISTFGLNNGDSSHPANIIKIPTITLLNAPTCAHIFVIMLARFNNPAPSAEATIV